MQNIYKNLKKIIKETDELKAIGIFSLCLSIVFAIISIASGNKPAAGAMHLFFGMYFVIQFLKWFKRENKGAYIYLGIATASIVLGFIRILGG